MGQCWELLSGLGQHSWDISAPFLFIQLPQQMTLCYWPGCDGQQVGQLLALAAMELSSVRDGTMLGGSGALEEATVTVTATLRQESLAWLVSGC